MCTVRLDLEVPSTHCIYSDYNGDDASEPIPASVLLTPPPDTEILGLDRLQISLVVVLSASTRNGIKDNQQFSSRVFRLLSLNLGSNPPQSMQNCSIVEHLTLCVPTVLDDCRLGYSPEKGNIYRIPFFMPTPVGIPGTTVTELGQVSTFLVASTITRAGYAIGASKEIKVVRQIIPGSDPIQHTRTYQSSTVVASVNIKQSLDSSTNSNISLTAEVFLKRPAVPTKRAMEFKCVAIRGLQWRVEEVTKVFNKAKDYHESRDESLFECQPDQSFTRELFHGYQKGYWSTPDNPIIQDQDLQQEKEWGVQIAFEIAMSRAVSPAPEVSLDCYQFESRPADYLPPCLQDDLSSTTSERLMITVEHRLKVDIITSEDTFHVHRKSLVERKSLQAALNASFPLRIVQKARGDIGVVGWRATPPCYSAIPASPPTYEPIL